MSEPEPPRRLSPLFSWRGSICDSDLPPTSRHVALTLSLHMSERGDSCWPSQTTLAKETGLNPETVKDHLRRLNETGWLLKKVERSKDRCGTKVYYEAVVPRGGVDDSPPGYGVDYPPGEVHDPRQEDVRESVIEHPPLSLPKGGRRKAPRIVEALLSDERPEDFEEFWRLYPRKDSKGDARKAWLQVFDSIPPMDVLRTSVSAVEAKVSRLHPTTDNWRKFIPYPAKWLRNMQWEDDLPEPIATPAEVARNCLVCGLSPIGDVSGCLIEVKGIGDLDACPWRR